MRGVPAALLSLDTAEADRALNLRRSNRRGCTFRENIIRSLVDGQIEF